MAVSNLEWRLHHRTELSHAPTHRAHDRPSHCHSLDLGSAQTATPGYQLPPKVIVDILDAAPPPTVELSPTRDTLALLERASMPTIARAVAADAAARRAAASTRGPTARTARSCRERSRSSRSPTAAETKVTLPPNPALTWIGFSPDGKRFAFTQTRDNGIELWVGDTATGQAKAVTPAQLNASLGTPCEWVGDGASLLCAFVSPSRGAAPAPPTVPTGPNIQETSRQVPRRCAPIRTC